MRKLGLARIFRFKGIFRLCLCLVLVGIIVLGAAEPTAAAPATGSLPVIKMFTGDPLTVPDGGHVVYAFEVYDGTKIQVIENGDIIDEFNGPPLTTSKGKSIGMTTNQIRTGNMDKFDTILRVSNPNGQREQKLSISFATKFVPKPASLIPPVSDNQSTSHKITWGPQTSASRTSTPSATSTVSNWPPKFANCPGGCNYCLEPDEAAGRGLTQKCSELPCYYTPDKARNWYCYGELKGWCCKDGKVSLATKDQCKEVGGSWYATEAEANKACALTMGWCCVEGKVYQATRDKAAQAGVTWYATEAEATKACQLPGWCCRNGQLTQSTQSQCVQSLAAAGGVWYATQAEAAKACVQVCWCCTNGRYGQTTPDACAKMGGTCYATQAQASERCQPLGWFCSGSKVYQGSQAQATQVGATWYATEAEATRACAPGCWCCTNGRYGQTTADACAKMGGTCYATQAQASERCQPPKYYCCSNGQVYQSTTLGAGCYTTLSQAQAACERPPITYWCCSNGQVYQSKTPGAGCYATQAEAQRACTVVRPPITPPKLSPIVPNLK